MKKKYVSTKYRKVKLGTVSHGTMKNEDLIPSFIDELKRIDIKREFKEVIKEGNKIIRKCSKDENLWNSEDNTIFLNEDLWNALDSFSPSCCYFGSTEGDGSDYGFWVCQDVESIFDGLKVSDLNEIPKDYEGEILFVNDHGNATLYNKFRTSQKLHEIWSIV